MEDKILEAKMKGTIFGYLVEMLSYKAGDTVEEIIDNFICGRKAGRREAYGEVTEMLKREGYPPLDKEHQWLFGQYYDNTFDALVHSMDDVNNF